MKIKMKPDRFDKGTKLERLGQQITTASRQILKTQQPDLNSIQNLKMNPLEGLELYLL